ncbi:ATP synthase F1 subunit epsilon [candidate division KSB1 bacterium 4572_119]|nr:MAG: ATP synthase F1 subunit epsilon [candidate division KSB1 bacterium 4572_119]
MDKVFDLEIITPLSVLYKAKIQHVRLPGVAGYLGIKAGHEPFVTTLTIGEIKANLENNDVKYFATSGGIVEVLPNITTILVETAEEATEINLERALYAKERAERRLAEKTTKTDINRAKLALAKAENRIKVIKKVKPE